MARFVYFFILIIILGCSPTDEELSIVSISDDINLYLSQGVDNNGPHPIIEVSTKETQPCSNLAFNYFLQTDSTDITLDILDISLEGACDQKPMKTTTRIPVLTPININSFKLIIKSIVENTGHLSSYDKVFNLQFESTEGFTLKNNEVLRIPNHSVWGAMEVPKDSITSYSNQLNQIIAPYKTNAYDMTPGEYGLFYYHGNQSSFDDMLVSSGPNISFFFKYNDWPSVAKAIKDFITSKSITNYKATNYIAEEI